MGPELLSYQWTGHIKACLSLLHTFSDMFYLSLFCVHYPYKTRNAKTPRFWEEKFLDAATLRQFCWKLIKLFYVMNLPASIILLLFLYGYLITLCPFAIPLLVPSTITMFRLVPVILINFPIHNTCTIGKLIFMFFSCGEQRFIWL